MTRGIVTKITKISTPPKNYPLYRIYHVCKFSVRMVFWSRGGLRSSIMLQRANITSSMKLTQYRNVCSCGHYFCCTILWEGKYASEMHCIFLVYMSYIPSPPPTFWKHLVCRCSHTLCTLPWSVLLDPHTLFPFPSLSHSLRHERVWS